MSMRRCALAGIAGVVLVALACGPVAARGGGGGGGHATGAGGAGHHRASPKAATGFVVPASKGNPAGSGAGAALGGTASP